MKEFFKSWGGIIGGTLASATVAVCTYAAVSFVTDIARKEASGYVSKTTFEAYQISHREWEEQVLKNIDKQLSVISEDQRDIKTDIKQLSRASRIGLIQ